MSLDPQTPKNAKKPTTLIFIRIIRAVVAAITMPAFVDALAVLALPFVAVARPTALSCGRWNAKPD